MAHAAQQLGLSLGQIDVSEEQLREAWKETQWKVSFDQAIQLHHFRICLKRLALIREKRKQKR